jgi:hypothetical protein
VKDLLANVGVDMIKSKEVKTDKVCIDDNGSPVCLDLETLKAIKAKLSEPAYTPAPQGGGEGGQGQGGQEGQGGGNEGGNGEGGNGNGGTPEPTPTPGPTPEPTPEPTPAQ